MKVIFLFNCTQYHLGSKCILPFIFECEIIFIFFFTETCLIMERKTKFFEKKLFLKIWGSINSKNNFFGLWVRKMIFFENSWVAYVPCTRNLGAFEFLLPSWKIDFEVIGAFLGPFLGVDRRKSLAGAPLKKLGNFKNFTKKNFRHRSIFQNFQLRCATKTRWDILKNFWVFFLSRHGKLIWKFINIRISHTPYLGAIFSSGLYSKKLIFKLP